MATHFLSVSVQWGHAGCLELATVAEVRPWKSANVTDRSPQPPRNWLVSQTGEGGWQGVAKPQQEASGPRQGEDGGGRAMEPEG